MKNNPLSEIRVLDLSHRLPGPMAGHLLASLGATVEKWEDQTFGDPFKDGLFQAMDPSFSLWYDELNKKKKVVKKNFKAKEFSQELKKKILSSDIVIMGLPTKLQEKFQVTRRDFEEEKGSVVILEMTASHHQKMGLHDLNILAMKNLLHLHVRGADRKTRLAPPFLPVAGIGFGTTLALYACAWLAQAKVGNQICYHTYSLEDSVELMYGPFYSLELQKSGQDTFLHNGRYPCYGLYPLKDRGWLAVASLEEKYWQEFTQTLGLNLSLSDRFHYKDDSVFKVIENKVKSLTFTEADSLFSNVDACVTPCS